MEALVRPRPLDARPVFVGDLLTATGFRLAGIESHVASGPQAVALLEQAASAGRLVYVTAELCAALPPRLAERLCRAHPLALVVLPDVDSGVLPPDVAAEARAALASGT